MDLDGDIEGEVTRNEAVRYLQGASGHALGSNLFLLFGGLLWVVDYRMLAFTSIFGAFLLAANGLSMWGWDRLRAYFAARTERAKESEPTRELTANPFSDDTRVEMQAGAAMILVFVGLLVLGRFALQFLGPRIVGYLCIGVLIVGNVIAVVVTRSTSPS